MKIKVVFEISDAQRRAINRTFGRPGPAPYALCKRWLQGNAMADLNAIEEDACPVCGEESGCPCR